MKTHILCSITFFRKSHRLWDNVEKCVGDRGATSDVTIWRIRVACWINKAICTYAHAHAHAPEYPHTRTHTQACTHTPICNTYCFSTATMVTRTRLIVTLYVHCLYCCKYDHSYNQTINISAVRMRTSCPLWFFRVFFISKERLKIEQNSDSKWIVGLLLWYVKEGKFCDNEAKGRFC